jgi:hypothetical protein
MGQVHPLKRGGRVEKIGSGMEEMQPSEELLTKSIFHKNANEIRVSQLGLYLDPKVFRLVDGGFRKTAS